MLFNYFFNNLIRSRFLGPHFHRRFKQTNAVCQFLFVGCVQYGNYISFFNGFPALLTQPNAGPKVNGIFHCVTPGTQYHRGTAGCFGINVPNVSVFICFQLILKFSTSEIARRIVNRARVAPLALDNLAQFGGGLTVVYLFL